MLPDTQLFSLALYFPLKVQSLHEILSKINASMLHVPLMAFGILLLFI